MSKGYIFSIIFNFLLTIALGYVIFWGGHSKAGNEIAENHRVIEEEKKNVERLSKELATITTQEYNIESDGDCAVVVSTQ